MAGVGDEIGEIIALGKMAGEWCRGIQHDDHGARLEDCLDASRYLSDQCIRHRQDGCLGAIQRRFGRHAGDAEFALQLLLARLADLDVPDIEPGPFEVLGKAEAHFSTRAEQCNRRH